MAKKKKEDNKEKVAETLKTDEEILDIVSGDDMPDALIFTNKPQIIETTLGPVEIKPWSLGEYARIGSVVEMMLGDLEKAGISTTLLFMRPASFAYHENILEPASRGEPIDPGLEEVFAEEVYREQAAITRMFARIAVSALKIIQHACGFTEEEVEGLSAEEGLGIFNVIVMKNVDVLGKAYELFGKHV